MKRLNLIILIIFSININANAQWIDITPDSGSWRVGYLTFFSIDTGRLSSCTGTNGPCGDFVTTSGGKSWKLLRQGVSGKNVHLFVIGQWTSKNVGYGYYPTNSDTVPDTLTRTLNGESTIQNIALPKEIRDSSGGFYNFYTIPGNDSLLFITIKYSDEGVWRSDDYGDTWKKVSDSVIQEITFNRAGTGYGVVTYRDQALDNTFFMKSTNMGKSWQKVGLMPSFTSGIQMLNDDTGFAYVTVQNPNDPFSPAGMYRSINGGKSWYHLTNGIPDSVGINPIAIVSMDFVSPKIGFCVGDKREGVFKTTDAGNSWSQVWTFSGTCIFNHVQALNKDDIYLSFQDNSNIYACIYKSTTGGETGMEDVPVSSRNWRVFPNPSSGKVNVMLSQTVKQGMLTVIDAQGREILRHQMQNQEQAKIDLSGFSSGIYLFRLVSGDRVWEKTVVKK